jgi:very-short-patch-repair endonuclease
MWESERRELRTRAAEILATPVWTAADLRSSGMRRHGIVTAVSDGRLVRARRDHYLDPEVAPELIAAVAAGGVLTCVSALRLLGVFVLDRPCLHVQVPPHATRLPEPGSDVVRHWGHSVEGAVPRGACAAPLDLLVHAVRCQPPRAAVATIDSALHTGLVRSSDLARVFAALPIRYRPLLALADGRAESGPETFTRLLLRGVAKKVEVQVRIAGVGRVDLLVDGWLVVECDSEAHHLGSEAYRTDRGRDLGLAAAGYTTLRVAAADAMWHPERVREAVHGLLAARRRRSRPPYSG